jgi:hypothetical protein
MVWLGSRDAIEITACLPRALEAARPPDQSEGSEYRIASAYPDPPCAVAEKKGASLSLGAEDKLRNLTHWGRQQVNDKSTDSADGGAIGTPRTDFSQCFAQ